MGCLIPNRECLEGQSLGLQWRMLTACRMSDLAVPMLLTFEDDAMAFWCFERLLHRVKKNFRHDESGIKYKSALLLVLKMGTVTSSGGFYISMQPRSMAAVIRGWRCVPPNKMHPSLRQNCTASHLNLQAAACGPGEDYGEDRSGAVPPPQAHQGSRLLLCISYGHCAAQARDAPAAGEISLAPVVKVFS